MAKVSVIIPNYNHADYLKQRIDSVLNQTYTDFEVILLDDCSSDRSKEMLLSYKDHPKISHLVLNEKNSGSPFEQWAKGFELATGEFIWIAESDDWCEPSLLKTLLKPLLEDETIVLSFCQSILVTDEGEIIYKTESRKIEQCLTGKDFVTSSMFGDTILVNAGMAVFRKSSLVNIDILYKSMKSAGDWMFWVNIALTGNIFVSGKYLNYFRRHTNTVSSNSIVSGLDIKEGNNVFQFVMKHSNPTLTEIKNAVKQRVDIYFQQVKKYKDKQTQVEALKSILSLHPLAKQLYIKKKIKQTINWLTGLFKKIN